MPKEQMVLRTWKRDFSVNEMYLGAAAANLKHNGTCDVETARRKLLLGETLHTKLAFFKLAPVGDGYDAPNQQASGRVNPNGHPALLASAESLLGV